MTAWRRQRRWLLDALPDGHARTFRPATAADRSASHSVVLAGVVGGQDAQATEGRRPPPHSLPPSGSPLTYLPSPPPPLSPPPSPPPPPFPLSLLPLPPLPSLSSWVRSPTLSPKGSFCSCFCWPHTMAYPEPGCAHEAGENFPMFGRQIALRVEQGCASFCITDFSSLHRFFVFGQGGKQMASKRPKGKKKVFKTSEIGFLVATTPADWKRYIKSFKDALTTPHFEIDLSPPRGAKGDPKKIAAAAAYLASYADIIVTAGTEAALACKEATRKDKSPPFVFASVGDPRSAA